MSILLYRLVIVEHLPGYQPRANSKYNRNQQEVNPRHRRAKTKINVGKANRVDQLRYFIIHERIDNRVNDDNRD